MQHDAHVGLFMIAWHIASQVTNLQSRWLNAVLCVIMTVNVQCPHSVNNKVKQFFFVVINSKKFLPEAAPYSTKLVFLKLCQLHHPVNSHTTSIFPVRPHSGVSVSSDSGNNRHIRRTKSTASTKKNPHSARTTAFPDILRQTSWSPRCPTVLSKPSVIRCFPESSCESHQAYRRYSLTTLW